mgnify:CR=1 FL=1
MPYIAPEVITEAKRMDLQLILVNTNRKNSLSFQATLTPLKPTTV